MIVDLIVVARARAAAGRVAKAAEAGGRVRAVEVVEIESGYGAACAAGIERVLARTPWPDAVAFLDADPSADPSELGAILAPLEAGEADLVIGSRVLGGHARELGWARRAGGRVALWLVHLLYRQRYTDLGPLRAARLPALIALGMRDRGAGWKLEMQIRAARTGLRVVEVPVHSGTGWPPSAREGARSIYRAARTLVRYATAR